jgi:AcrR family transcriptional regulator
MTPVSTGAYTPERMRSHARANRERILAAAETVFGTHGAQASTEEVARRADVGIATVFRHFPTKSALVEAALLRHFARLDDEAAELAAELDPEEALQRLLTTMVDSGATKLALAGLVGEPGELPPAVRDAADRLRATMGTILARAQATGAVRPDVSVDEIYVLVRGLAQATAAQPPPPETLSRAIDVILRGLAAGR